MRKEVEQIKYMWQELVSESDTPMLVFETDELMYLVSESDTPMQLVSESDTPMYLVSESDTPMLLAKCYLIVRK